MSYFKIALRVNHVCDVVYTFPEFRRRFPEKISESAIDSINRTGFAEFQLDGVFYRARRVAAR